MLIFSWETKEESFCSFFFRERKREARIIKKGVLGYSLHKRGLKEILVPTLRLSKSQIIDNEIVVWSWSRCSWRQSVDSKLQEYFLNPFSLKLILELIYIGWRSSLHVRVVLPYKLFICFFFFFKYYSIAFFTHHMQIDGSLPLVAHSETNV